MARRAHPIEDRTTELVAGVVLAVVGSFLLWDAYEGRGRPRPFAAKLLPL